MRLLKLKLFPLVIMPFLLGSIDGVSQTVSFSVPSDPCIDQSIYPVNNSVGIDSYTWDFCSSDLTSSPEATTVGSIVSSVTLISMTMVSTTDGLWYGFGVSRDNNNVYQFSYGGSLLFEPTAAVELVVGGASFSSPYDMSVVEQGGNYYGFVINGSGSLVKLDFGSDLGNTSVIGTSFSDLGLSTPRSIEVMQEGGSFYGVVSNFGDSKLTIINLGSDLSSVSPTVLDVLITGGSGLLGLSIEKEGSTWYGLVSSFSNSKLFRVDFGNVLNDAVTSDNVTDLSAHVPGLSLPTDVEILGSEGIAFLQQDGVNGLRKLSFASGLSGDPTASLVGGLPLGYTNVYGIDFSFQGTDWVGIGANYSSKDFYRISFPRICEGSLGSVDVTASEPAGVSYTSSGTKYIRLTGTHSGGSKASIVKSLEVGSGVSPDIDFSYDNICVDNPVNFVSINESDDIVSYDWFFDGVAGPSTQDASMSFSSTGVHTIRLEVSNGSCTNEVEKEITVYPAVTVPSFTSSGSLCTNNQINFTNTSDDSGYPAGVVSYKWYVNDEQVSIEASPMLTFSSAGDYTVKVERIIPGCQSEYSELFSIAEGPTVSFSYNGGCWDTATSQALVQFSSTVSSADVVYDWDFGDGQSSGLASPEHTYTLAGDYEVFLEVTDNVSGCIITTTGQTVTITDQPLADFTPTTGVENIAVQFIGVDQTGEGDAISSWAWDFGGQGSSTDQSPAFAFSSPSTYDVALTVSTANGCGYTLHKDVEIGASTKAELNITVPAEICIGEGLLIENNSVNAVSYTWDFCSSDLASSPEVAILGSMASSVTLIGMTTASSTDGLWYGFGVSRDNNNVYQFSYGGSLLFEPTAAVELVVGGASFSSPYDMSVVEQGGNYYGFVINGSGSLVKLDFGSDLGNTSVIGTSFSDLGLSTPRSIEVMQEGGSFYGVVSNFGDSKLTIINLGSDLSSVSPTVLDVLITGGSGLLGLSIEKEGSTWYGLVSSFSNSKLFRVDFGNVLNDAVTSDNVTDLSAHVPGLSLPTDVEILGSEGIAFLQQDGVNGLRKLSFASGLSGDPTASLVGGLPLGYTNVYGIDFSFQGTDWVGIGANYSSKDFYRISFPRICEGSLGSVDVTASEPTGVSYTSSGTKYIRLTGTHSGGSKASIVKSLEVGSGVSPDIDFSYDNICLSAPTTFTSTNLSGDITTYSWDFDGDGIEDSTDPNPTYQFSSAGEYEVILTVQNDGGCSNTARQTIGIYDISEPDFSLTYNGGLCSNNTLSLKDGTPDLPPDSLVTWTWDFNGEATIQGKDTTYAFATAGEKIITLTVGIPGCEASVSKTINLLEGPTVGFTVGSNCISPTTQFNNTTTGDGITGYTWDFGNGYTSSTKSPETFFKTIGDYQVSLTVRNDLGCETTLTKKVAISAIPKPDFKHDLACSGAAVQFTDQSTAENANITEWSWDFAGLGTSNERNPIFEFPTAGKYTIKLSASSNYGCSKILTREIDVLPSPTVAFLINTGCEGQATTFVDQSAGSANNPIVDRLWSINNQFYSAPTVNEVFKNPGSYDVTLQITTKNLCTISLTKTLQVNELPSVDFGFISACVNELTEFSDLSTSPDDPIISRKWDFAGQASANGPKAYYQFKQAGNYNVSLFLKTEKGCEISISKNVTINNSPVAAFSHSLSVGQLPVTVNFTNESNGATAYSWFVGDGVASVSNEQDISQVFDKEGDYLVSLVAYNEFGCSDTTSTVVTVALPKVDLQLRSVNYTDTEGKLKFILNIANRGSIAQTNFPIEIVVDDRVTISEKYSGTVAPGKSVSHSLQFELVTTNNPVEKVCIKLVPILKDTEFEFSPHDNTNCLSFTEGFLVNNPYPNPVDDRLTFELILPEAGDAEITVLSMTGQPMFSEKYYTLKAGLTAVSLQMAHYTKGIYLLRVQSKGNEAVRRVVKR